MIDALALPTFSPAALALNLRPGADTMFRRAQGLKGGPRAVLAADAGMVLGCIVSGIGAAWRAHPHQRAGCRATPVIPVGRATRLGPLQKG